MADKYKLIGHLPVPCGDLREWALWFEAADRVVAKTKVGSSFVSTIFLGMDHNFEKGGDPLLFETIIFDDGGESYQERCSTWAEAEEMHAKAITVARERLRVLPGEGGC